MIEPLEGERLPHLPQFSRDSPASRSPGLRTKGSAPKAIPQNDLLAAREVWHQQGLSARMVADFTATASGELFLYVNDAIQLLPFGGPFDRYYNNNGGSAEVTVQRIPLPPGR